MYKTFKQYLEEHPHTFLTFDNFNGFVFLFKDGEGNTYSYKTPKPFNYLRAQSLEYFGEPDSICDNNLLPLFGE
jgi:hypothetical protein